MLFLVTKELAHGSRLGPIKNGMNAPQLFIQERAVVSNRMLKYSETSRTYLAFYSH